MQARSLDPVIRQDLADKMVFLAGPRQVGKTTLARLVLEDWNEGAYLSWDSREVDFLVTVARKPWFAVEVKVSETRVDPALVHFRERLAIPWTYQAVLEGTRDFLESGVRVLPVGRFLAALV